METELAEKEVESAALELPEGLTNRDKAYPLIYVSTGSRDINDPAHQEKINEAIYQALEKVHPGSVSGQALIKVHIGEAKCVTRMKPEFAESGAKFLLDKGASSVVAGDSTVAYTGPRGHKQNPAQDVSAYLGLAKRNGWSEQGPAGVPFVVLDRPGSSAPGRFEFKQDEEERRIKGVKVFSDFFPAGGFISADFIINNAHLTLHGLAGVAACSKSIAMGCSALKGKLRMHQALLPRFDPDLCIACCECVEACPEGALSYSEEKGCPVVEPDSCIGCGECEAVCEQRGVKLEQREVTDWERGEDTLYYRMADYMLGLMNGKWENTIHLLHMYNITARCDCLDRTQKPMVDANPGFLVSKNPFALDRLAGELLLNACRDERRSYEENLIVTADQSARYVEKTYGIISDVEPVTIDV